MTSPSANPAEAALRESEERFRLVANTPVLIWMSGVDKLCTYFNKPWLDFTGRPLPSELGNGWSEGVHPDDWQRRLETYAQAFDARREFRMEYRPRRFDGVFRWVFVGRCHRLTLILYGLPNIHIRSDVPQVAGMRSGSPAGQRLADHPLLGPAVGCGQPVGGAV